MMFKKSYTTGGNQDRLWQLQEQLQHVSLFISIIIYMDKEESKFKLNESN